MAQTAVACQTHAGQLPNFTAPALAE